MITILSRPTRLITAHKRNSVREVMKLWKSCQKKFYSHVPILLFVFLEWCTSCITSELKSKKLGAQNALETPFSFSDTFFLVLRSFDCRILKARRTKVPPSAMHPHTWHITSFFLSHNVIQFMWPRRVSTLLYVSNIRGAAHKKLHLALSVPWGTTKGTLLDQPAHD